MSMFFIIFLAILILMYGYIGWRVIIPSHLPVVWEIALFGLIVAGIVALLLPFFLRFSGYQAKWTMAVAWFGYMFFGFMSMMVIFFVLRDLGWLAWLGIEKIAKSASTVTDPERRRWLLNATNVGLLSAGALATGYGWYQAAKTPRVLEVDIPIARLPKALDGFKLVQISDLHAGATITREFMERVVDRVMELNGDLIALTGDLVDGTVDQLKDIVQPIERLSAPYGKFFITGNHEYYSGVEQWVDWVRHLGFEVLLNEHRLIVRDGWRFVLAGVTDHSGGQFLPSHKTDPEGAITGAPRDTARILLAHQPIQIFEAAKYDYDLMISGHTHGGQYFPYHVLVAMFQPYISGLHRYQNKTWVYVSRGTGTWGPQIRVGAPSEITIIKLRHAEASA